MLRGGEARAPAPGARHRGAARAGTCTRCAWRTGNRATASELRSLPTFPKSFGTDLSVPKALWFDILCTASPSTTTLSRKILAANPQVGGWTYIPSTFPPGQGRVRRGVERRRAAPGTATPPPPAAPFFAPEVPPGVVSTWAEGLAREEGRGRRGPWLTGAGTVGSGTTRPVRKAVDNPM